VHGLHQVRARGPADSIIPNLSSPDKEGRTLGAWAFALALFVSCLPIHSPDLFWHLSAGRWMAAHRAIPSSDPFSFTRLGEPWLDFEWLLQLFWYGVHGCEALFTIMGTGCESVSRTHTKETDVVVGTWKDGRIGSFRGIRGGKADYGAIAFGDKGIVHSSLGGSYEPLVIEIVKYFKTGAVPVSPEETLELFAFMEAADVSKQRGAAVKLAEVLEMARKK
jgi:hypothetical protein